MNKGGEVVRVFSNKSTKVYKITTTTTIIAQHDAFLKFDNFA